ncbi:hypothetical protein [Plasmodium yoelii yoelii]|uniref:Uncharacterized protein n=1 Tax=Plasmodium yoelii yoelii TaxID=73239 RepID=Q7RT86_PLAYO|nr:hypothetical protein [Plasmodium yoelii yoelii]
MARIRTDIQPYISMCNALNANNHGEIMNNPIMQFSAI